MWHLLLLFQMKISKKKESDRILKITTCLWSFSCHQKLLEVSTIFLCLRRDEEKLNSKRYDKKRAISNITLHLFEVMAYLSVILCLIKEIYFKRHMLYKFLIKIIKKLNRKWDPDIILIREKSDYIKLCLNLNARGYKPVGLMIFSLSITEMQWFW